jgi:hypothetical protein
MKKRDFPEVISEINYQHFIIISLLIFNSVDVAHAHETN